MPEQRFVPFHAAFHFPHGFQVGATVWDSSLVLARLLECEAVFPEGSLRGKRAVEVGAGVGVVGLALGMYSGTNGGWRRW